MGTKRLAILLVGALLLSHQSFAAEFTVDSTADDVDLTPGDGVCSTVTGQCTLRAAIQETNALNGADIINLPGGTYELTRQNESEGSDFSGQQFTDESGDLDITDQLTITGNGPGAPVINRTVSGRVFHIAPGATVEFIGLQMRGGIDWGGGGVSNAGILTLSDCVVSDNIAADAFRRSGGGGIYNVGTLTMNGTTVQHNSATWKGGGIYNEGGDVSMSGGALLSNRANLNFVSGYRPSGQGGGLANEGGSTTLTGVTIARNQIERGLSVETYGSGIANLQGQINVDNSTISDNSERRDSAEVNEIENRDQMTLNNVTIGERGLRSEGTLGLQNTIIAGACTGTLQSLGHNLIADATGCTVLGDSTGNLLGVDPRLGPLQDNGGLMETRALLPGSPAIDAGDAATCEATDQRGINRPLDGDLDGRAICDIGAYEADGSEQERPWLAAAALPGSRSVLVGTPATAFAAILNAGPETATACTITSTTFIRADFSYQTTEPINNEPIGTPNTPVDIAPGTGQTFLVAFIPSSYFDEEVVRFQFDCTNADPAPIIVGVNTLLLSASEVPIPDIVAASATINNDGIVNIPGQTGSGVFAVATANVGVAGAITVFADTGTVTLPVSVFVCETNPATSACLADPGPDVTTTIGSNATPTFGVFVVGGGAVPFDPANNRIFVRFREEFGQTRGSTSVAVRTQ